MLLFIQSKFFHTWTVKNHKMLTQKTSVRFINAHYFSYGYILVQILEKKLFLR